MAVIPLTTSELADKIGTGPGQIGAWKRGPYGMPRPVGVHHGPGRPTDLWDWPTVWKWLVATNRWDPVSNTRTRTHRERPSLPENERWAAKRAWAERTGWA